MRPHATISWIHFTNGTHVFHEIMEATWSNCFPYAKPARTDTSTEIPIGSRFEPINSTYSTDWKINRFRNMTSYWKRQYFLARSRNTSTINFNSDVSCILFWNCFPLWLFVGFNYAKHRRLFQYDSIVDRAIQHDSIWNQICSYLETPFSPEAGHMIFQQNSFLVQKHEKAGPNKTKTSKKDWIIVGPFIDVLAWQPHHWWQPYSQPSVSPWIIWTSSWWFQSHPLLKKMTCKTVKIGFHFPIKFRAENKQLLGSGFNPSGKYSSKWESSPNRGDNKKSLKPPPRLFS